MNYAGNDYLANEVLTASPQKLQLLLVEAALRFGNLAQKHWRSNDDAAANEALIRCQQIVAEMIAGLNPEENPDLVRRIVAVYLFVYRSLVAANFDHSEPKLHDALRVLEVERETWRQACQSTQRAAGPHIVTHDSVSERGQSFVA